MREKGSTTVDTGLTRRKDESGTGHAKAGATVQVPPLNLTGTAAVATSSGQGLASPPHARGGRGEGIETAAATTVRARGTLRVDEIKVAMVYRAKARLHARHNCQRHGGGRSAVTKPRFS